MDAAVSEIKAREPQAIFVNLGIASAGALIKKMREQGLTQPLFSNFWTGKQEAIDIAGKKNVEGTIFVEASLRRPNFMSLFTQLFGAARPSGVSYACYAALASALNALSTHPQACDRESIYRALLETAEVPLLDERLEIAGREAHFKLVYRIISHGAVRDLTKDEEGHDESCRSERVQTTAWGESGLTFEVCE
jgi:hypothetical protein